jgi:hypothetical protein
VAVHNPLGILQKNLLGKNLEIDGVISPSKMVNYIQHSFKVANFIILKFQCGQLFIQIKEDILFRVLKLLLPNIYFLKGKKLISQIKLLKGDYSFHILCQLKEELMQSLFYKPHMIN